MLMKTLAYLECPTGIAGDMCLGALVHAGVPLSYLESQLAQLGLQDEFRLRSESVLRNQQAATKVYVDLLEANGDGGSDRLNHHHHRHHGDQHHHDGHTHNEQTHSPKHHSGRRLPEIEALIQRADLPERVTTWSLAVFRRLAEAEAAVHGIAPEQVHFHEVGATDAIVDIVGTCLGLDWLQIDQLICSPLPTGGGQVRCDHGLLPVPVPAVLKMMASAQMPVYSNGIDRELVTPTGCAIAATLSASFGPPPRFTLQKIGLGAGGRDLPLPNILRLWIGTVEASAVETLPAGVQQRSARQRLDKSSTIRSLSAEAPETEAPETEAPETEAPETEPIIELQTQLDDCSPQAIGYLFDRLFAVGAVDVFSQAVAMKKNRLGTLLTVLCPPAAASTCESTLFRETTTLGIRQTQQRRTVLAREMVTVTTTYGQVPIKVARAQPGGAVLNLHPEYEDCAELARSHNIPWRQVHQAAMVAAAHWQRNGQSVGENSLGSVQ